MEKPDFNSLEEAFDFIAAAKAAGRIATLASEPTPDLAPEQPTTSEPPAAPAALETQQSEQYEQPSVPDTHAGFARAYFSAVGLDFDDLARLGYVSAPRGGPTNGKPRHFFFNYASPPATNGFRRTRWDRHKNKYTQPKDTNAEIYFISPIHFERAKASGLVVIVEGEAKTLGVELRLGLPSFSVGGCYSWGDGNRGLNETIVAVIRDKQLLMFMDSDVTTHPKVASGWIAFYRLAVKVAREIVIVAPLPADTKGTKVGPDDWVHRNSGSADDIEKLLNGADGDEANGLVRIAPDQLALLEAVHLPADRIDSQQARRIVDMLLARGADIFLRTGAGSLATVERVAQRASAEERAAEDEARVKGRIFLPSGTLTVKLMEPPHLQWLADEHKLPLIKTDKHGEHEARLRAADAGYILSNAGAFSGLAGLAMVAPLPWMRDDGSIEAAPGWCEETQCWHDFPAGLGEAIAAAVPERPTRDEARRAAQAYLEPFRQFPFATSNADPKGELHRAAYLSEGLTPIARAVLATVPLFAHDGNNNGIGKTELANATGIITLGRRPPVLSESKHLDDNLDALLLAGVPLILLDNFNETLEGSDLAATLTAAEKIVKVFYTQRRPPVPIMATFILTAKQLKVSFEMARRLINVRLVSDLERPDRRNDIADLGLLRTLSRSRTQMLVHLYTILRAWRQAAQAIPFPPQGSFIDWSQDVAGAVWWATGRNVFETQDTLTVVNSDREQVAPVLAAVYAVQQLLGAKGVAGWSARQMCEACLTEQGQAAGGLELAKHFRPNKAKGETPDISDMRLGKWLSVHREAVTGGYKLHKREGDNGSVYRVERVAVDLCQGGGGENLADPGGGLPGL